MKKIRMRCLILCISLFLAGCGADGSGDGRSSAAGGDPAGGSTASGEEQPNIMDNPAYNPGNRQVLTMVLTFPSPDALYWVRDYNASSQSYFIEIKTYNDVGTEEEFKKLETQLTLEILSGKGPDLVLWNGFYTQSLASEKLMENLYDFMDTDPDFHREDYYENILEAFEMNGGLYVLPTSFGVNTVCGRPEELGTDRGVSESWELGEMIEAFKSCPQAELLFYPNKEYTLRYVLKPCIGNFVDWSSGECHFDTPEFVELLELCNTFPEGFEEDNYLESLRSGRYFWLPVGCSTPWNVADARVQYDDSALLWPGYPVADGEKELGGGVAVPGGESFSICKNSSNQEAAWEFIKSFLAEDTQREREGIPLLRSVSEERIQEAMTVEYETVDGIEQEKIRYEQRIVITEGVEEEIIGLSCITESDVEIYRSIIENTHRSWSSNSGMMEIIMEEAGVYFGDGKDAATVADIIQNRVKIYVSERMN